MAGLLILGLIAGWVALWVYVFKKARNRAERVVAILVAVLIPFWDLPIGYSQYYLLCTRESGIRTYGPITPQDKVYFESDPPTSVNDLLKQGFKVVEISRLGGKGIARYEIHEGKIVSRTVQGPESLIAVLIKHDERLTWNIYREQHLARSLSSNKLIASFTAFSWYGGWLQESAAPLLRGRLKCSAGHPDPLIEVLLTGS